MDDHHDIVGTPRPRAERWRRWLVALALVAGLATATTLALGAPVTVPHAVEPAPVARPTGVCGGVTGCSVVARTDVDGDGRADEIGIVPRGLDRVEKPGTVTVRVQTATKRLVSTTSRDVWWYGNPSEVWAGSAEIDSARGAELVVGQAMGAHTLQYRVLTFSEGRLTTLSSPRAPKKTDQSRDTETWTVDGSYSFQAGIKRAVSGGRVYVTVKSAERNDSGSGHTGWTVKYLRTDNTWKAISTKRVRYDTDRAAATVGGWHVRGVRRFD